jgi:hypothetical protein
MSSGETDSPDSAMLEEDSFEVFSAVGMEIGEEGGSSEVGDSTEDGAGTFDSGGTMVVSWLGANDSNEDFSSCEGDCGSSESEGGHVATVS